MSRQPRFEIVRTDAGWHARFVAGNGLITWATEVYTRRRGALDAIYRTARAFSPTARIWVSSDRINNEAVGSEIRVGHPSDDYSTANVVEVRDVDERGAA